MALNTENKALIEEKIRETLQQTREEVKRLRELTAPIAPDCAVGRVSRMDAINNKSINEAALRTAENKLKGLEIALQNIDDPGFGKCSRCGNPIPLGRILLMPHSRFCVHCAT